MRTRAATILARLRRSESGAAALEFALVAPFLILLAFGGFEICRFILVQQKAEKMAYSVADVTSQLEAVTAGDLYQVFEATEQIMNPYDFGARGAAIISSVFREEDEEEPVVRWQCRTLGGLENASLVGDAGEEADIPGDLLIDEKDGVIVSEVYYEYVPLISSDFFLDSIVIHRSAVFRPRLGALTTAPGCPA